MAFSLSLLILVLLGMSVVNPVCSGTEQSACGSECFWASGVCKAFVGADCQSSNCAAGCVYAAEVPATCNDTQAETCKALTSETCSANSECDLTSGTCVLSAPPNCAITNLEDDSCPSGCSSVTVVSCVPHESGHSSSTCSNRSTEANTSKCALLAKEIPICKESGQTCELDISIYSAVCDTLSLDKCVERSGGTCVVSGNKCIVGDFNAACAQYDSDDCGDICRLSGSNCVFNENFCSQFSTDPISECERSDSCKVVENDCVDKTPAEICLSKSVLKCAEDSNVQCEVDGNGVCVPHVPNCRMNAAGTQCDSNNEARDNCYRKTLYSCEVDDYCFEAFEEEDCGATEGCTWDTGAVTCFSQSPANCNVQKDIGCDSDASPACAGNAGMEESCTVNPAIDDNTCESKGISACNTGCKWSTAEGSCVDRNCSNSASYSTCCSDASCAYCTVSPKPSDCPSTDPCVNTPSYANCCNSASCTYCEADPKPSDCSAASHIYAPVLLLIAVLFMGWF